MRKSISIIITILILIMAMADSVSAQRFGKESKAACHDMLNVLIKDSYISWEYYDYTRRAFIDPDIWNGINAQVRWSIAICSVAVSQRTIDTLYIFDKHTKELLGTYSVISGMWIDISALNKLLK